MKRSPGYRESRSRFRCVAPADVWEAKHDVYVVLFALAEDRGGDAFVAFPVDVRRGEVLEATKIVLELRSDGWVARNDGSHTFAG